MFATVRDRAQRVEEIEKALAAADRIAEIDPALIDASPIRDRLPGPEADEAALAESVAEHGQRVPGLVRPSASDPGRYVVVYGHRRLAAAKRAGRPFRTVVADLSDEEAFIAQGLENNDRKDLSFIERALFARRLSDAGATMPTIAASLKTARPNIVVMIGLARRIPEDIILAIGPSPALGQPRWQALDSVIKKFGDSECEAAWRAAIAQPHFAGLDPGARLADILRALQSPMAGNSRAIRDVADAAGGVFARVKRSRSGAMTIELPRAANVPARPDGRPFDEWLAARLAQLRDEWRSDR